MLPFPNFFHGFSGIWLALAFATVFPPRPLDIIMQTINLLSRSIQSNTYPARGQVAVKCPRAYKPSCSARAGRGVVFGCREVLDSLQVPPRPRAPCCYSEPSVVWPPSRAHVLYSLPASLGTLDHSAGKQDGRDPVVKRYCAICPFAAEEWR